MIQQKKIFFILLVFYLAKAEKPIMKFHEFFLDQLALDGYRTEKIAYDIFKKKPIKKNINYLVMPWSKLYFNGINKVKPDLSDIPQDIRVEDSFTICSHDYYKEIIPILKRMGVKVLFSTCCEKRNHDGIKVLSIPYAARTTQGPARTKNVFFSFIGQPSHKTRFDIFSKLYRYPDTVIIKRHQFHYALKDKKMLEIHEREYKDVLSRSRYALCPRGNSAGSYRFWEALKAGAIPVLISDDYLLPQGYDWSKCIIRVNESDITRIPSILYAITASKENEMRQQCYEAYKLHSGEKLVRVIRHYYKNHN